MNCNIIKDLLPSYIDEICSEDTTKAVEEHIAHCEACQRYLQMIKQPPHTVQMMDEEVKVAKEPFKRINKKWRIHVLLAITITFMITTIGTFVVHEVGAVRQILFPIEIGLVDVIDDTEEWQRVKFDEQNYVIFDSIFWDKAIVNDVASEKAVLLRIKDDNGNVVIDEIQIPAGKSVKFDSLKRNEKYYIEIKASQGRFFINAT